MCVYVLVCVRELHVSFVFLFVRCYGCVACVVYVECFVVCDGFCLFLVCSYKYLYIYIEMFMMTLFVFVG